MPRFEPKLVTVLREGYTRKLFARDAVSGVIVGIVALPLAIAFAIASGVKPEQGLYTAIVAGFLISIFSGSRVQIGGPTGAFIVIIYGVVQKFGYDGLATATLIAGVLLIVMGLARLGAVIQFIPYPVTVGFTAGIALIICTGQIRDLLGLQIDNVPAEFVAKWRVYTSHVGAVNPWSTLIGGVTILLVGLWPRLTRVVPGSLVAILLATAAVQLLRLPVETIATRFGSVPTQLPAPRLPNLQWGAIRELFSPALSIALLAGIESLLSAVVADGMTGRRHRPNTELVAQGIANVVSPIFLGIPATGAIARTATNIRNGAKTPVSGMIHAVTLLLIMLFFGKWASLIPMAALAGILVVVSYQMSEWRFFVRLFRGPKTDITVLLITFLLTVLVDLTVAIQVGVVLAALMFMHRMSEVTQARFVGRAEEEEVEDPLSIALREVPDEIAVFEINGPFFFGAAEKFKSAMGRVDRKPHVLIFRLRHVLTMDATGLHAMEEVLAKARRDGTHLLLSGVHAQPLLLMKQTGFAQQVGDDNIFDGIDGALERGKALLREDRKQ